ncbi:putative sugar phosphate/phosphate translocator [Beauveria bassiana]|nr:putative sugar phosphate/phosphate translocator [Beauveria bassiana]
MLFLNASVAFMLNIASVFLIGKTSGLVLTLTGILKAILLVAVSVVIWKTPITLLQAVGYGIALLGLSYYSLGYDGTLKVYNNSFAYISATFNSYGAVPGSPDGVRGGLLTRRYIVLGSAVLGLLFVLAVLYGWVNAVPTGMPTTSLGAN